mmetsp:Transcript_87890/g.233746  ORF Transcript_87890/g.233746 Transcript_87890/m.233746 type:complete len:90 (+) Transcript_87890:14-283(+)
MTYKNCLFPGKPHLQTLDAIFHVPPSEATLFLSIPTNKFETHRFNGQLSERSCRVPGRYGFILHGVRERAKLRLPMLLVFALPQHLPDL